MIKERILDSIEKRLGEYSSAKKLHEVFGLSLTYIYTLTKNENINYKKKYGHKIYEVESFVKSLLESKNNNYIAPLLIKEDFDINNFYNWEAQNPIEEYLENFVLDELGEFTSVKELVKLFGIAKSTWYEIMERGEIIYFNIEKRKIILTKSLLPYLRKSMEEKL